MKILSAFAIAALLGSSLAIAQGASPPGGEGTQAAPPPPSASPSQPGASTSQGESSTATHGKHMSRRACSKQARAKHLKGSERKQFMKDCEAGKSPD